MQEHGGQVVFLHRILPGATDRSYGIHVAQLAGIPREVVSRAEEVLGTLEVQTGPRPARNRRPRAPDASLLPLFAEPPDPRTMENAAP